MLYTQNFVVNGDFALWDSSVPREMDAQITNTTLTRLQETFREDDPRRHAWAEISGRNGDRFTYAGRDALRAALTSSAVASDFRLYPEGLSATAFTGTSTFQILMKPLRRYRLAFAARCNTDGNALLARIVLRDNTDTVKLYLASTGAWEATETIGPYSFDLTTRWQAYGITFDCPPSDASGVVIENMVWQLANGTAGAQIIDIGEIRCECLSISEGSR